MSTLISFCPLRQFMSVNFCPISLLCPPYSLSVHLIQFLSNFLLSVYFTPFLSTFINFCLVFSFMSILLLSVHFRQFLSNIFFLYPSYSLSIQLSPLLSTFVNYCLLLYNFIQLFYWWTEELRKWTNYLICR